MRDDNYGFPAIYQRYRALGGTPIMLKDTTQYNLADLLSGIYGPKYVSDPKLETLVNLNGITKLGFVKGEDEPNLFLTKEFVNLQNSTLRKVECIAAILELQIIGQLKTKPSGVRERWQGVYNHPTMQIILVISALASIIGLIITIAVLLSNAGQ